MKIKTLVFTYNDEKIIPYTMRHYTRFSTVVIVDNGSSDNTIETAFKHGASGTIFSKMRDELDDLKLAEMKSNYWKDIDADWLIICDADEFVWHPDLVDVLRKTKATIIEPKWVEMFSETYPTTDGQIYDEIKTGVIGGGFKTNLFRPSEITDINYGVGCHTCDPKGNVVYEKNEEILCLHMQHLSLRVLIEKAEKRRERLSNRNKQMGWSSHLLQSPEEITEFFNKYMALSTQVIP